MSALLDVQDLRVKLNTRTGAVHALRGFSLGVEAGEAHGLVGESGSGKSIAALTIMGLPPRGAEVSAHTLRFADHDLAALTPRKREALRGRRIAMVFQDPMSSLNPLMTVGRQISETLQTQLGLRRQGASARAVDLLREVGIPDPERRSRQYPHQFSGGMRQRAMIALAISCEPELLIADEPTTALDVTVQAQILSLLESLVRTRNLALLLITHDLGIVARTCSRVTVAYGGMGVESGSVETLLHRPRHPYTQALLACLPTIAPDADRRLLPIPGSQRVPREALTCCPFVERCSHRLDACSARRPPVAGEPTALAACFNPVWGQASPS